MKWLATVGSMAAGFGLAAGMVVLAPAAVADNYAPQLPSNSVQRFQVLTLVITGAQPGCRVTYSIRGATLVRVIRVAVRPDGVAKARLRAPGKRGTYSLMTRVDNFAGKTGCTTTKTVQRIRVS
jgi:hypothetical protein